jgi:hypothetical protein
MSVIREIESHGWRFRFELASQVLSLDVPEWGFDFRDEPEPLLATPPLAPSGPVSAAALLLKAKQFDDGLYAAVELAAQRGAGRFAGKASLLRSLADSVPILAACRLGNVPVLVPDSLAESVQDAIDRFLGDQAAKPVGFYTWSDELRSIFHQDRFLQQPLVDDVADDLLRTIEQTPGALGSYEATLQLASWLSNLPARPGLQSNSAGRSFFPASRSHEQILLDQLYGDRPIPDGFDLMEELIRRVKSGKLSLRPSSTSGWYDHQTWSMEPLLRLASAPEGARLRIGNGYQQHLEDLFRSILALARETHVKQLAGAVGGCMPRPAIEVRPDLTVEPLPTMYARRADCYRFVQSILEVTFGTGLNEMHRLTADGPVSATLADELVDLKRLFDGAAATANRELGIEADQDDVARTHFAAWREKMASDADVSKDVRRHAVRHPRPSPWASYGCGAELIAADRQPQPTTSCANSATPV